MFRFLNRIRQVYDYYKQVNKNNYSPDSNYPYVRKYNIYENQFVFWIADENAEKWYKHSDHAQRSEILNLLRLVKPGDKVLEIGSHHGFLTMYLSRLVGNSGYVLGIEAPPYNCLIANSNIGANNLTNCKILNYAAAENSGEIMIYNNTNSGVYNNDDKNGLIVNSITGDILNNSYGSFDLLKVDVEGFEGKILKGCKRILEYKPKLAIELHLSMMGNYETNIEDIFNQIDIDKYVGVLIKRSNIYESSPFNSKNIPQEDIINLLLRPKNKLCNY